MNRIALGAIVVATVSWISAVSSCSDDTVSPDEARLEALRNIAPDPELVAFLKDNFGVRITGLEEAAEFRYDPDGTLVASAEGVIELDGAGSADIYIHERIFPQADGGDVELYVEDLGTGESRFFYYDPVDSFVVFSRELEEGVGGLEKPERGVAVAREADGSYSVWTFDDAVAPGREMVQKFESGYEALALVNEYAEFNEISPHIKMAAIAIGYTDVPEGRLPIIASTRP